MIMASLIITYFGKRRFAADSDITYEEFDDELGVEYEEEHYNTVKKYPLIRMGSVVTTIASAYIFLTTQDISQQMIYTDRWTFLHAGIVVLTFVLAVMSRQRNKPIDEDLYKDSVL